MYAFCCAISLQESAVLKVLAFCFQVYALINEGRDGVREKSRAHQCNGSMPSRGIINNSQIILFIKYYVSVVGNTD